MHILLERYNRWLGGTTGELSRPAHAGLNQASGTTAESQRFNRQSAKTLASGTTGHPGGSTGGVSLHSNCNILRELPVGVSSNKVISLEITLHT